MVSAFEIAVVVPVEDARKWEIRFQQRPVGGADLKK